MKTISFKFIPLALCAVLLTQDAMAWGPQSTKAISLAAMQLARRKAPEAFTAGDVRYERDLLLGAEAGVDVISDEMPLNDDVQTLNAVYSQIQILREARRRGAGSYFAYRMGVLSSLVSRVMLPYGFAFDEDDQWLYEKIQEDLETNVNTFTFNSVKTDYHYIRTPVLYFNARRTFHEADKQFLLDDYTRGRGKDGFLAGAGASYFRRAVETVADAWYTVLRPESDPTDVRPSDRQMAQYYIDEVGYLLQVRKNLEYAQRAYELFESVNPGIGNAYVDIGDLYYGFGTQEGIDRGVLEWKIAQRIPGEPRQMASERLSQHYMSEGERLFLKSSSPDATEIDLPDSLEAFQLALEYDRKNQMAAKRISETSVAIQERRDEYKMQQTFLESAMKMVKEAERSRIEKDFSSALSSYNLALMLSESVTGDFKGLYSAARESASSIKKDLKSVVSEVLDAANESMEKGDTALNSKNYDGAIQFYRQVEVIVEVIPGVPGSINEQRKEEIIETAENLILEAEIQQKQNAPKAQSTPPVGGLRGN